MLNSAQKLIVLTNKMNQLRPFGCRECQQLHLQVRQDLQVGQDLRVHYACDFEAFT